MVWFKVDDTLAFHHKTVAAGNAAMGLWVRAGSWCSQQLTDGCVPNHMIASLGRPSEARKLVEVGLWEKTDSGFRFHEWEDRNPARDKVEQERQATRERVANWRAKQKSNSVTEEESNGVTDPYVTEGVTVPPTRPDPTRPLYNEPASAGSVRAVPSTDENRAPTVQTLIAEWIDHVPKRPPGAVIGQVSKLLKSMLDEGIEYADVRAGLAAWQAKGLHPSTLPSVVHEIRTATTTVKPPRRQQETDDLFTRAARRNGLLPDTPDQKALGA